jgi:hypothetical protein
MQDLTDRIKRDSEERVLRNNDGNPDFLLYLDNRVFQKGEAIDCVNTRIEIDQPTLAVFVDDEPGKNFGHRCHYLLYNAETGEFVRKISAQFPHFFRETPDTLDLFRASPSSHPLYRKKKIRTRLDVGRLSAYRRLSVFRERASPFCSQEHRMAGTSTIWNSCTVPW